MDTQQLKEPLQIFQTFTGLFSTHSNKLALNETKTTSTQQKCLELFIQTASTSGTSRAALQVEPQFQQNIAPIIVKLAVMWVPATLLQRKQRSYFNTNFKSCETCTVKELCCSITSSLGCNFNWIPSV